MEQNPFEAPQTDPVDRASPRRPPPPRNLSEALWRLAFGGFPGWLKIVMLLVLGITVLFVVAAIFVGRR